MAIKANKNTKFRIFVAVCVKKTFVIDMVLARSGFSYNSKKTLRLKKRFCEGKK